MNLKSEPRECNVEFSLSNFISPFYNLKLIFSESNFDAFYC